MKNKTKSKTIKSKNVHILAVLNSSFSDKQSELDSMTKTTMHDLPKITTTTTLPTITTLPTFITRNPIEYESTALDASMSTEPTMNTGMSISLLREST